MSVPHLDSPAVCRYPYPLPIPNRSLRSSDRFVTPPRYVVPMSTERTNTENLFAAQGLEATEIFSGDATAARIARRVTRARRLNSQTLPALLPTLDPVAETARDGGSARAIGRRRWPTPRALSWWSPGRGPGRPSSSSAVPSISYEATSLRPTRSSCSPSARGRRRVGPPHRRRPGSVPPGVAASTFHSFSYRLLETYAPAALGWSDMPTLLTGPEQVALVGELLRSEDPATGRRRCAASSAPGPLPKRSPISCSAPASSSSMRLHSPRGAPPTRTGRHSPRSTRSTGTN